MSRCFPFPPPGYEKKARTDDGDALKKEKDKDKKRKKEKKDKEKKEGKEKREKDRSNGKHRAKKDKKEKHRDKKDKDREKDEDKSSASDGKRPLVQSEHNNGDNKALDKRKHSRKFEANSGELFAEKGKERVVDRNSISVEKKFSGQLSGFDGEKLSQNSHLAKHPKDSKFVQDLGSKVRDDDQNQLAEKFMATDAKGGKGIARVVANATSTSAEGKEKGEKGIARVVANATCTSAEGKEKSKRGDDGKLNRQVIRKEARIVGNAHSISGMVQTRVGVPRSMKKDIEKKMERKEKTKEKEIDNKRGEKHKDKYKEKKDQGKDKDRNKKKKEEKVKREHKIKEPEKLKEIKKEGLIGIHNVNTSHLPKDSTKSAVNEGNIRKRKDSDTNGFLHANDIKPNKLPRPTTTSHSLTENGRIVETGQTPVLLLSGRQGAVNDPKVDNKEQKKNGMIEAWALSASSKVQPLSFPSIKPSPVTAQADQTTEVPGRPPHPDSRFLCEVLTVPRMDEWPDFVDQEWLFQSCDSHAKKPKVGSFADDETLQVWSEALRLESADICALPYVVPY